MAIETWSPSGTLWGTGGITGKPPGKGWVQTGTRRVAAVGAPKQGGPMYRTVPIYTRQKPAAKKKRAAARKPAAPRKPPAPEPALTPAPNPYQDRITEEEAIADAAPDVTPVMPTIADSGTSSLEETLKELINTLSINSNEQLNAAVEDVTPQVDPELVKANEAIAAMQAQLAEQSTLFGQSAADQASQYQSAVQSLESRLAQEAENYKLQIQGLAESQRANQINQARASLAPQFQIGSQAYKGYGGTAPFKIRRQAPNAYLPSIGGNALNTPNLNVLNV